MDENFLSQIRVFIRTLYMVAEPLIDDASDDLEELIATEAAALALGSDETWDDKAFGKIANLLEGASARLKAKLAAGAQPEPTA